MSVRERHEQGLARFLNSKDQVRFRESLTNKRLRKKLQDRLGHFETYLDPRYISKHDPGGLFDNQVSALVESLRSVGAPQTCFVVSQDDRDGTELPLEVAVEEMMYWGSALISCVPGELAVYISEEPTTALILHRPSAGAWQHSGSGPWSGPDG